jgi:chromosome segregation ATPase
MASYEEYLKRLNHKKYTAEMLLVPYENNVKALEVELSDKNTTRNNLLNDLKLNKQRYGELSEELDIKKKKYDELLNDLKPVEQRYGELSEDLGIKKQMYDELLNDLKPVKQRYGELSKDLDIKKQEYDELSKNFDINKQRYNELLKDLNFLEQQGHDEFLKDLKQQHEDLLKKLNSQREEYDILSKELVEKKRKAQEQREEQERTVTARAVAEAEAKKKKEQQKKRREWILSGFMILNFILIFVLPFEMLLAIKIAFGCIYIAFLLSTYYKNGCANWSIGCFSLFAICCVFIYNAGFVGILLFASCLISIYMAKVYREELC